MKEYIRRKGDGNALIGVQSTGSRVQLFWEMVIPENTAEDEMQKTTKGLGVSELTPKATGTLSCFEAH